MRGLQFKIKDIFVIYMEEICFLGGVVLHSTFFSYSWYKKCKYLMNPFDLFKFLFYS